MVDLGKAGQTSNLINLEARVEPTLEGSEKRKHPLIRDVSRKAGLPPKDQTYTNIEALMNHFKMVMNGHGIRPPKEKPTPLWKAETESWDSMLSVTGPTIHGESGAALPCFPIMAGIHNVLERGQIADIVATFGSVNMIAGELEQMSTPFQFSAENQERFMLILNRYPNKRAAMLPALHLIQEQQGYISPEAGRIRGPKTGSPGG